MIGCGTQTYPLCIHKQTEPTGSKPWKAPGHVPLRLLDTCIGCGGVHAT